MSNSQIRMWVEKTCLMRGPFVLEESGLKQGGREGECMLTLDRSRG